MQHSAVDSVVKVLHCRLKFINSTDHQASDSAQQYEQTIDSLVLARHLTFKATYQSADHVLTSAHLLASLETARRKYHHHCLPRA
jgi:hypothetical protein